ncbi:MAG: hypothetical protein DWP95_11355 [Proteobacteria bacterium]|nr:MAG: hypothetical protein DWP95_11355 [Pseudomonadota bacterium]
MQNNKSIFIVQFIAIITLATALYSLPGVIKLIWWELSSSSLSHSWSDIYWQNLLWTVWIALLLVLKMVVAYGLFRIRVWAWCFALCVLTVDFLIRLSGIITIWLHRQPGPPPAFNAGEGGAVVIGSLSHWPMYLWAAYSLILIIILLQKPIRSVFKTNSSSDSI